MMLRIHSAAVFAGLSLFAAVETARGDPAASVNCFIGSAGYGNETPSATRPFGMVQAGPDTGFGSDWYCSGYHYEDKSIKMFSQTHSAGAGCPDYGDVGIMPFVGAADDAESTFSHSEETAEPGYYAVTLQKGGIRVEATATEHVALYRISFPRGADGKLLIDLDHGMDKDSAWAKKSVRALESKWICRSELRTHLLRNGWIKNRHVCLALHVRPEPLGIEELPYAEGVHAPRYVLDFGKTGHQVQLTIGLSTVSPEGAAGNVRAEVADRSFDDIRREARASWNEVLSCATPSGCDKNREVTFMTSLYHMFLTPVNITDADGKYRGGDGRVATVSKGRYYSDFSVWDTFRAVHPFFALVLAGRNADFVNSLVAHQNALGYLPIQPRWGQDTQCMIGTHAVSVIAEAYFKGVDGVDWNRAYESVRVTLREKHPTRIKERWDILDKYGYYPCDMIRGESVSRTLECSYDDWCAGQMAAALGHKDDEKYFTKRSQSWRNVVDASAGAVRGRKADGAWRTPFDPLELGRGAGIDNDFTEANALQYTWHVLQSPQSLLEELGGRVKSAALIDALFKPTEEELRDKRPAIARGGFGQYWHGNEPCHHVPYLYQYVGRPDRTAETVKDICDKLYANHPYGISGNDDHGQMGAWFVFSCMGFYPVSPASGTYVVGAPQIPKVSLRLANGKTLTIVAKGLSDSRRYVEKWSFASGASSQQTGASSGFVLRHSDLMKGGELVFTMAEKARAISGK